MRFLVIRDSETKGFESLLSALEEAKKQKSEYLVIFDRYKNVLLEDSGYKDTKQLLKEKRVYGVRATENNKKIYFFSKKSYTDFEKIDSIFNGLCEVDIIVQEAMNLANKLIEEGEIEVKEEKKEYEKAIKLDSLKEQVGGNHYKKMKIEPLEYILENDFSFLEGNIIKYISRYKSKNGLEDLKKAEHYLKILIEREEKKNKNE